MLRVSWHRVLKSRHRRSRAIIEALVDRRRIVLALAITLGLGLSIAATGIEIDFTPDELFDDDGPQRDAAHAFQQRYGNTDDTLVILVEAPAVLTVPVVSYVRDLTSRLSVATWTEDIQSIATLSLPVRTGPPRSATEPLPESALLADVATGRLAVTPLVAEGPVTPTRIRELKRRMQDVPLVQGRLVSRDGTVAVIAVRIKREYHRVAQLRAVIDEVEALLAARPPPAETSAHLGGLPFIRVDVVRSIERDQRVLFPLAFGIILLLLLLGFRWLPAVAVPLVVVALSAGSLVGAMALLGLQLDIITNMVPVLVIVIGVSDSVHLVSRYRDVLSSSSSRLESARSAARSMCTALLATSLTTAVGFASLAVSDLPVLIRFGLTAAAGVMLAYVLTMAILPAGLALAPAPRRATRASDPVHERFVAAIVARVLSRRLWVLAGATIVAVAAALLARGVPIDTAVHHQFDEDNGAYHAIRLLETKLDGLRPVEVDLRGNSAQMNQLEVLNAVQDVAIWARRQPGVISATSYADLFHEAWYAATGDPRARSSKLRDAALVGTLQWMLAQQPAALARYEAADGSGARMNIQLRDMGGKATVHFAARLRDRLSTRLPTNVTIALSGEGYVSSANLTTLTRDLLVSMFIAVAVIFGFMTLMLRSVRLGLISVPPNLLPLVMTIGYLRLRGLPLSPATAIIFSISIGLAVDGTIHLLTRFREELCTNNHRDVALQRAARASGKAVVLGYLSIIIGFAVFQLSSFVPIRQFGELVAVTIVGCLFSTLIVLPALIGVAWPEQLQSRA